ncbi:MAG: helix-turn-helix domain-containing protein [Pseudomonadota bacterium]
MSDKKRVVIIGAGVGGMCAGALLSRQGFDVTICEAIDVVGGRTRTQVIVAAHIDFVSAGEIVDHSCLVVDGIVGRFGQNGKGERQVTCLHVRGDMADLPSVVSPKVGWGLTALPRTTVLRIPHRELRSIASTYPGVAEAFWRDCVVDGSIFSEWVVNVGRRSALVRVAHLLCEMAIRSERAGTGDKHSYPLPITQADLGDATGLTVVHVNRTLRRMREQSIATFYGGKVIINDWQRVVKSCNFDDAFMLLDGPAPRISEAA